jgi:MFS family permease
MAHAASFDKNRRARTMSYMSAGEDAGEMIGPVVAGLLWSTWGVPVLLGSRVVLAVIAELYTVSVTRSFERRSQRPLWWRGSTPSDVTAPNESD